MGVLNFFEHSKAHTQSLVQPDDKPFESKAEREIFVRSIGDHYVANLELNLSERELNKMSITDGAEMWRLFVLFRHKMSIDDPSILEEDDRRLDRLAHSIASKVMNAKELYCIYSTITGEPYLFSDTIPFGEKYICTPPDIRFATPCFLEYMKEKYPKDIFEFKKIENGENGDGIKTFISKCVHINGACGYEINSEYAAVDSEFVEIPRIAIPEDVNPDLMKWMILLSQIETIASEDDRLIYNLYFGFFSREILDAKFLVPVKENGDKIWGYPILPGKFDRQAVAIFTDMHRFNEYYKGWNYRLASISDIISNYDVIINNTSHPKLGFYIGEQTYSDILNRAMNSIAE